MSSKADITFLLNPAETVCRTPERASEPMSPPPMSPSASLFHCLSPLACSPELTTSTFSYRRRLVSPYMAPIEKRRDEFRSYGSKRAEFPAMSMAALCCECFSPSDDEQSDASSTLMTPAEGRPRKGHSPPCQVEGCKNLAVSRGCCVRHGGGSKCTAPGCNKRAKLYQRCFQHGGYKMCTEPGCTKKAKRYGHCWSHGGGHICEVPECTKVSTQGGFCWAHGGGNRCKHEGCNRRSYQKYDYYCMRHAQPAKVEA